ncbi:hypothetical protein Tco_1094584 [Tanacetum coccineum]|uniref:Uncharacterized protein n=1 Tax=Tanacetum coccineum TaxID=301880 RepID=A0ABQ5IFX9_9ASTR
MTRRFEAWNEDVLCKNVSLIDVGLSVEEQTILFMEAQDRPSVEEQTIFIMEAQDHMKKRPLFKMASVRSKLQLADATGITNLPDADVYVGLATLAGYVGDHVPLMPAMLVGAAPDQGKDTKIPQSQGPTMTPVPDEATTIRVGVNTEGATTTTTGLDAGLDNGNINESSLRSHDTPLHDVNMSRSLEDSLKLKELSLLIPKLELKIGILEKELKDTKQTFGNVILTLVDRVKSLKVALKRKSKKVILSESEDKETENQGRKIQDIDDDPLVSLVRDFVTLTKIRVASQKARSTDKGRRYKRRKMSKGKDISAGLDVEVEVNTGNEEVNTGIKETNTGSTKFNTGSIPVSTPSILQKIRQEEAGLAEAMRLKAQMDEEVAKQVHLDEMVAKRVQAKAKRSKPMTQAQQRDYMSTFIKNQSMWKLAQLKKLTFEELKTEYEKLVKSIESFVHMGSKERVKRQGIQLEQETSRKQKIDVEDVPEEKGDEPMKKRGKRKKQIARTGKHIDKTAQDETKEEKEAFMKDKVTGASLESDIGIDAIPTATKPPSIVDWKIIPQSGLKYVYQIIRIDGSDKIYISFGAILKDFSRDDLTELYILVIKKYGANRPKEMYDIVLWGDLKTMFDPPISDDAIWSLPL